nr:ABC transporter ATP-binding protein [Petrachloros mirabilis]
MALICTLGYGLTMPILAYLLGQVSTYIGQQDLRALLQLPAMAAVLFLARGLFQYGQDTLMASVVFQIALDLRVNLYRHLLYLDWDYFQESATGDLAYRLTAEVDRIGELLNKLFHQFIPCSWQLVAVLTYMVYLNGLLTLATLFIVPLMTVLVGGFGQRLLRLSRQSQNRISNLSTQATEVLAGIRLVKAFVAEEAVMTRFGQEAEHHRQAKYATERIRAIQYPVVGFLEAMAVAVLFVLGGWQIFLGRLSGSGFISFIAAVALLSDPIQRVTSSFNEFKQAQASIDRVFKLFQLQPQVQEHPQAVALPHVQGKVEFCQVSFAYGGGQPVLHRFDLRVWPGEVVALVGTSGAGKTTLMNLLLRFYDPQGGHICIDGMDLRRVTLRSLRQQIGIVPQEVGLFSGTVAQNIALGQLEWDFAAIQAAAEAANAHAFIMELPQGYETGLGERGVNLSGGQRQRLAIARAILLNPRILILDEATSALDSESEGLVQEALEQLMGGRTVFMIAHRLATVRKCDRILVLERGQIIESGTHEQLMTQMHSQYARFYAQQFF